VNKALSALRSYQARIRTQVELLTTRIGASIQKPVDATLVINYFAFDTMAELTFSRSFNMLTTGEMSDVMRIVHRGQRILGVFSHIPWIYNIAARVPGFITRQFAAVTNKMIRERRKVANGASPLPPIPFFSRIDTPCSERTDLTSTPAVFYR